jgi:hypothetical protein
MWDTWYGVHKKDYLGVIDGRRHEMGAHLDYADLNQRLRIKRLSRNFYWIKERHTPLTRLATLLYIFPSHSFTDSEYLYESGEFKQRTPRQRYLLDNKITNQVKEKQK